MRVWNQRQLDNSLSTFDAEARVRFAIVRERFSTRVTLNRADLTIETTLISGPFRRLENHWKFTAEGSATRVEFAIDFEFGSRLLEGILAANANRAAAKLMSCFEARATSFVRHNTCCWQGRNVKPRFPGPSRGDGFPTNSLLFRFYVA